MAELNEKLYEYHAEHFHCNYKDIQDYFKQNNIGYYRLNSLIEEYVCNCPVWFKVAEPLIEQIY